MDLGFAFSHGPKGSEGDPECIFFPFDTSQETSVVTFYDPTAETGVSFWTDGTRKTEDGPPKDRQTWKLNRLFRLYFIIKAGS